MENYFGSNLKFLRTVKKVEQDEIAKLVGLKSSSGISEWEKGLRLPTIGKLAILANFFDCTIDELVREDMSAIKTKESNIIFSDDDFKLASETRALKEKYKPIIGDQLKNMTYEIMPSREKMKNYLQDLPLAAFGGGVDLEKMTDDEMYELYKKLTD